MIHVLDACALISFLRGEPGAKIVQTILKKNQCFVHALNLCEVYYDFLKVSHTSDADAAINDLIAAGIIERNDIDKSFWKEVGIFKASNKLSLADCFALTLTRRVTGKLVTSDRKEFEPIANQGICSIEFIR